MTRTDLRRRLVDLLDRLPVTCRAELVEWEITGRRQDLAAALNSRGCRLEGRKQACWCGKNMTPEHRQRVDAADEQAASAALVPGDNDPWAAPASAPEPCQATDDEAEAGRRSG